ncbi:MAG: carboxypeptidase-like regulatory domain-containing protein [Flavobacteriaceae bacterium]|nr:carboxypeptidase-like regulatory domain-containing protein [Flavobacteriaceae bacterium]
MKIIYILLFLLGLSAHSQSVKGIVYHEGKPLSEVNILIKKSQKGTHTNAKGEFELGVKKGDVLIFSHINMRSKKIKIKNFKTIEIELKAKTNTLDEVVVKTRRKADPKRKYVQTGFGRLDKRRSGSSMFALYAEDLKGLHGLGISRSLQGKVPGLTVNMETEDVYLRASISGFEAQPAIWEVDGVIFRQPPTFVDVSTVESIHIVKSGPLISLYGSEAAGGIIIITTKFGSGGSSAIKRSYPQLYSLRPNRVQLPETNDAISKMLQAHKSNPDSLPLQTLRLAAHVYNHKKQARTALRMRQWILSQDTTNILYYRDVAASLLKLGKKKAAWNIYRSLLSKPGFEQTDAASYRAIFHDIEYLYHAHGLKDFLQKEFKTQKHLNNRAYENKTRLVLEWTVADEALSIEIVNPNNQSIVHQLGSSITKSPKIQEIYLNETFKGAWVLNLSLLENITEEGYLKISVYRDWISPTSKAPKTKVYILSDLNQSKYKLMELSL